MIEAVVFDLDGLMFNTEELYPQVGAEVLRRRGERMTSELLDQMMGLRPHQAIAKMIEHHALPDTVEEILDESKEIFVPLLDNELRPMPGLMRLLDRLEQANIPKAVATSSGQEFAVNVLSRFELLPRLAFVLTAEDVTHGKPNPEIYERAAKRLGIVPAHMLVLEDSHIGLSAAVAAGAIAVAVPGTHSAHHDFSHATEIVASLDDPALLKRIDHAG